MLLGQEASRQMTPKPPEQVFTSFVWWDFITTLNPHYGMPSLFCLQMAIIFNQRPMNWYRVWRGQWVQISFLLVHSLLLQQKITKDVMDIIVHLLEILYFDLSVVYSMYSKKSTYEYLLARREDCGRNGKVVIKNASVCPGWCGELGNFLI